MFGLSPWEILVVLIIAVLLFGKRLPEIGSSLGKAITNFKNSSRNPSLDNDSDKIDYTQTSGTVESEVVDVDKK